MILECPVILQKCQFTNTRVFLGCSIGSVQLVIKLRGDETRDEKRLCFLQCLTPLVLSLVLLVSQVIPYYIVEFEAKRLCIFATKQ